MQFVQGFILIIYFCICVSTDNNNTLQTAIEFIDPHIFAHSVNSVLSVRPFGFSTITFETDGQVSTEKVDNWMDWAHR